VRIPALDRLRAVALAMMVVHHLTKWLSAADPRRVLPGWDGFALTDVAAPAFTVAAGASGVLWALRRPTRARTVVRRYGLLVPTGMLLQYLFTSGTLLDWGVLQALGTGVVISTLLVLALRTRGEAAMAGATAALAGVALLAGPVIEVAVDGVDDGGWAATILGGTFPAITYTGLALVGATGGVLLRRDPSRGTLALAAGVALAAVTVGLVALGHPPDRYPGGPTFLAPGLAGTLLLFGALDRWRFPSAFGHHALGIFIAHYAGFWVAARFGARGALDPMAAVVIGVLATVVLAVVAPRVPPLRWSPRTGWRQKRRASSAAYRATTASVSAVRSTASTTSASREAGMAQV